MTVLLVAFGLVGWFVALAVILYARHVEGERATLEGYNRILAAIVAGRLDVHVIKRTRRYGSVDALLDSLNEEG